MNREACETCAFGPAGAGKEPYNALRGEVCAAGAVPFWCHEGWDWKAGPPPPGQRLTICRGWQARVREHRAKGRYADRKRRGVRYWIAHNVLLWIEVFVGATGDDRRRAMREIKHGLKLLMGRGL